MKYTYKGDRLTAPSLRGLQCDPVLRADGKCITSPMSTMLVKDASGKKYVILRRQLRKNLQQLRLPGMEA